MNILQVCNYAADYEGNFIKSLINLEKVLNKKGHSVYYAFPEAARNKKWCLDIQKKTKVFFLPIAKARILPQTYMIFRKIYLHNSIDIVHTHFELYDIPATLTAPKHVKVIWHLHDAIVKQKQRSRNILNKIQYSIFSKRAYLISVSDYYRRVVEDMGFNIEKATTVLNGIDLKRIEDCTNKNKTFDILAFGWNFYQKGTDITIKAIQRLINEGYSIRLLLNGNENTESILKEFLSGEVPDWIEVGRPELNINKLFRNTHLVVQSSRRETFSYVVCEATYAGLPVIASDIPGLEWARELPTVSFFENENVNALYHKLKEYFTGPRFISNQEITKARKIIEEKYSIDVWVNKIIDVYNYYGELND